MDKNDVNSLIGNYSNVKIIKHKISSQKITEAYINKLLKDYNQKKIQLTQNYEFDNLFPRSELQGIGAREKELLSSFVRHVNDDVKKVIYSHKNEIQLEEKLKDCNAAVLSVDIRNSTFLMEHCKDSESFASFINAVTHEFKRIVFKNYGIYDKFTGDGFICYFPEFFSGEDFALYAINTAMECHNVFNKIFEKQQNLFDLLMEERGLGIGIDIGRISIRMITDDITIIGKPVVHACRLNGAPGGKTYINNQAYVFLTQKYKKLFKFKEANFEYKHIGNILAREFIPTAELKDFEAYVPNFESVFL